MTTEVAEQKRRSDGFLGCEGGGSFSSLGCSAASGKRLKKNELCHKNLVAGSSREREAAEGKDRIGKRVAALQQLVSPFGKTDTASVLQETADYINFLHAQLQESYRRSLRARGLCLVPLPCALRLARSNGADIWAPNKTNSRGS
ncbi:unnamed protein product [Spirodela intermedia]|uniref:BHLH domain-containing protein n=1 Tax=Spirodela intermedia TaxID=51605 RepID=A0A7I8IS18_SPIIN|nr:unnamed protein product [Spirodela intermedia]CAA6660327.1 unnamed protein product [Spirodela intermedia]